VEENLVNVNYCEVNNWEVEIFIYPTSFYMVHNALASSLEEVLCSIVGN